MPVPARERLAFALDVPDLEAARSWIERLSEHVGVFKIGLELFVQAGVPAIELVRASGARCFLDLKLHDIPETVARAVAAAAGHRVDYLTVHASGGRSMLERAVAAAGASVPAPMILAITVLTSMDDAAVQQVGYARSASDSARDLAALAMNARVGGLVCSAREVASLRATAPNAFLVTPGIRPKGAARDDQSRVATAADAIRAGADLLVVGRPIRDAADPVATARALVAEIESARS